MLARFLIRILFYGLLLWVIGLLWFITIMPHHPTEDTTETDAIVVLTGGSLRMEYGLELIAQHKAKKLFISGVGKGVKVSELIAQARTTTPISSDIEHAIIVLGHTAFDTKGNARETSEWMEKEGYHSLRLVTANYHMPRSMMELQRLMPDVTIIPDPVFPENYKQNEWWRFRGTISLTLSEYHKYLASELHYLLVKSNILVNEI